MTRPARRMDAYKTQKGPVPLRAPDGIGSEREMTGSASDQFSYAIINQAVGTIWLGNDADPDTRQLLYQSALIALKGFEPRNEIEGMAAAQLVALHYSAMECFRRAASAGVAAEFRDMNLRHGAALSRAFGELLAHYQKRRSRGRQRVTVRHIHVFKGGQAVVGVVENGAPGHSLEIEGQPHAKPIAHAPQPALRSARQDDGEPVPLAGGQRQG